MPVVAKFTEEWVKANAGRLVVCNKGLGKIVGYFLQQDGTFFVILYTPTLPANYVLESFNTWVMDGVDKDSNKFLWIWDVNLIVRFADEEKEDSIGKNKEIPDWPHICPKCSGAAYMSAFFITCQRGCKL